MNQSKISAIHHITAIAASAAENLEFYEEVLGLRLVKQTVNFDDPYTYHLYYADGAGSPGTIMTFFSWEGAPSGSPGSGMMVAISFSAPLTSMGYWYERLTGRGIDVQRDLRFDEPVLKFRDPHGLSLELIGVSSIPSSHPWQESPVEASQGLLGFHSATALLNYFGRHTRSFGRNHGHGTPRQGRQPVSVQNERIPIAWPFFRRTGGPSCG